MTAGSWVPCVIMGVHMVERCGGYNCTPKLGPQPHTIFHPSLLIFRCNWLMYVDVWPIPKKGRTAPQHYSRPARHRGSQHRSLSAVLWASADGRLSACGAPSPGLCTLVKIHLKGNLFPAKGRIILKVDIEIWYNMIQHPSCNLLYIGFLGLPITSVSWWSWDIMGITAAAWGNWTYHIPGRDRGVTGAGHCELWPDGYMGCVHILLISVII